MKTEPSKGSAARPHPAQNPAQNRGPGAPRRGFLPPPNGAADPRSGASFPRYNPTRPPGRGSVWQSTWFGIRGSQVQILPPRRGPSPRRFLADGSGRSQVPADGFRQTVPQTGSARRVPPDGARDGFRPRGGHGIRPFGRIFSHPLPTQERGGHFGTHPWFKTCIFRRSCRRRFVPAVPFFLLLLLDIPETGVMELVRMFAPSATAHSLVSVRSEPYFAGFLPLGPVAHILAARLAGAGTRRFALSYRRWE